MDVLYCKYIPANVKNTLLLTDVFISRTFASSCDGLEFCFPNETNFTFLPNTFWQVHMKIKGFHVG